MKKIVFILSFVLMSAKLFAQAGDYSDLIILFADKKYEKLVKDAEKYTQKEETKNDPIPYIFMSKGLYQISFNNERDEAYKNAFKDAIKYLGDAVKKDKSGEAIKEHIEYFDELVLSLVEMIENDISAKEFKKAGGWVTRAYKIFPKDPGVQYLDAAMKFRSGDKSGATTLWKEADKQLKSIQSLDTYSESKKKIFVLGIVQTAETYVSAKQVEKAKTLLNNVKDLIGDDDTFTEAYNAIVK